MCKALHSVLAIERGLNHSRCAHRAHRLPGGGERSPDVLKLFQQTLGWDTGVRSPRSRCKQRLKEIWFHMLWTIQLTSKASLNPHDNSKNRHEGGGPEPEELRLTDVKSSDPRCRAGARCGWDADGACLTRKTVLCQLHLGGPG